MRGLNIEYDKFLIFHIEIAYTYHLLFVEKHRIQFLVTKNGEKLNLIEFSDPRSRKCGQFHLLSFLRDHFVKSKAEKHEIPFLVTKSGEKLNLI